MDDCQHAVISRREETKPAWRCEACDEHFIPAQTLVTLAQGLATIWHGSLNEEI